MVENAKMPKFKCDILSNFQTMWLYIHQYFTRNVGNQYSDMFYTSVYVSFSFSLKTWSYRKGHLFTWLSKCQFNCFQFPSSTFSMQLSSGKDSCWNPTSELLCAQWNLFLLLFSFHPFRWLLQRLIRLQVQ